MSSAKLHYTNMMVLAGAVALSACSAVQDGDQAACEKIIDQYNQVLQITPITPKGTVPTESRTKAESLTRELIEVDARSALDEVDDENIRERVQELARSEADGIDIAVGHIAAACRMAGIDVEIERQNIDW
ncbi:MAG: hypothetical protein LKI58_11985 [Actinomyces sp.]|jgi:hypothetical protein|nr:hypothetical protein [Actinomyces sp.]MCI1788752.1 hypothetical protein [Actinomyces sp.]MCI1831147.1 hypothetical protein [Actinomyces sp.]